MLENFDGDILKLRSGHASNDFLSKLNNLRNAGLFLDIDLMLLDTELKKNERKSIDQSFTEEQEEENERKNKEENEEDANLNSIQAHKIVLICCSPYFEKMFSENFSEKEQKIVYIGGHLDHLAFEQIINFFYTGTLEITSYNAIDLLEVADLLLLEQTKNYLLKYMQQTLNSENCILYKNVGSTFSCKALMETSDRFARRNFEDVCRR